VFSNAVAGEKLRIFIFIPCPQPLHMPVFEQGRSGKPGRQQEPNLLRVVISRWRSAIPIAWNGGFMGSMKKWMLAAALAAGTLAFSAAPAQAARIGVFVGVGAHSAYIPPSPGPGYTWIAGYWANGYWNPGYWNFVGVGFGRPYIGGRVVIDRGPAFYHRDFDRHFDRDNHFRR
jgi:hypothetical protein